MPSTPPSHRSSPNLHRRSRATTKTSDGTPLPRVPARDPTHSCLPLCAGAGSVPVPTSDQLFLKMMDKGPIRSREHSALQSQPELVCPDLPTHLLCATLRTPQYASIHFERRLHNPRSFVFTQNIKLLPHLFVHAIPIAQPPRSSLLQIPVSTMLRVGLHASRQQSAAGALSIQRYRFINISNEVGLVKGV